MPSPPSPAPFVLQTPWLASLHILSHKPQTNPTPKTPNQPPQISAKQIIATQSRHFTDIIKLNLSLLKKIVIKDAESDVIEKVQADNKSRTEAPGQCLKATGIDCRERGRNSEGADGSLCRELWRGTIWRGIGEDAFMLIRLIFFETNASIILWERESEMGKKKLLSAYERWWYRYLK